MSRGDIERPGYGKPCNGCGKCCQEEACELSLEYLKSAKAPCVALEFKDGRYWCGLITNPAKHLGLPEWAYEFAMIELSPKFANALAVSQGCDAYFGDSDERRKEAA